jgi:hypothetical protein
MPSRTVTQSKIPAVPKHSPLAAHHQVGRLRLVLGHAVAVIDDLHGIVRPPVPPEGDLDPDPGSVGVPCVRDQLGNCGGDARVKLGSELLHKGAAELEDQPPAGSRALTFHVSSLCDWCRQRRDDNQPTFSHPSC